MVVNKNIASADSKSTHLGQEEVKRSWQGFLFQEEHAESMLSRLGGQPC